MVHSGDRVEPAPGRGIVAARLRGTGRHTKALVLLCHMDLARANPKAMRRCLQHTGSSTTAKYGDCTGRLPDDKGPGVIELMAMLALKRAGILLNRDVIFLATGDEEEGGKNGAGWMVAHEASVFADARYLLNEGGGIMSRPNGRKYYGVSLSEKTPLWLRLTATGDSGHAAVPPDNTAVTRLIAALDRLAVAYRAAIRVINPVRRLFPRDSRATRRRAARSSSKSSRVVLLRNVVSATKFRSEPCQNALVRDTFTPNRTDSGSPARPTLFPRAPPPKSIDSRCCPATTRNDCVIADLRAKSSPTTPSRSTCMLNFPAESSPRKSELG